MSASPSRADLRAARDRLGITQAEAARLALVSVRAWGKYEQGERQIPAPTWALFRLRARLVTLAQLAREAA